MVSPSIVLQLDWSECGENIPTAFWSLAPKVEEAQCVPQINLLPERNNLNAIPNRD
jgi:hypothetical protein